MEWRPSNRRSSHSSEIVLNLVPMMDALVTLIAFLLFTMSFLAFVSMDSPVPIASEPKDSTLNEKPLQLTLTVTKDKVILWSPFDRIASREIDRKPGGEIDLAKIHETLLAVKKEFPTERSIIFDPNGDLTYESLVALMDTVRILEKTDGPIFSKDAAGVSQQVKDLFPNVVFGNVLENNP